MSNQWTPSSPQLFGTPIINGPNVYTSLGALSTSALTTSAIDITQSNLVSFTFTKFGSVTSDCTITMQLSIDGGTNYRDFQTFTNAQITSANGNAYTLQVKGTNIHFTLNPGTLTGGNGFNVKILV